jgi:uncharacterized protein (TIGR03067 family)
VKSIVAALLVAAPLWLVGSFGPGATAAPEPPSASAAEVLKMLGGTWKIVSLEVDGEALGADQDATTVVVEEDRFTIKGASRVEPYTVKLNTSVKPWRIDMTFDAPKSRPCLGIFKFEADKLTIVCGEAGGTRPDKFDGNSGTKFVLRKAKGQ